MLHTRPPSLFCTLVAVLAGLLLVAGPCCGQTLPPEMLEDPPPPGEQDQEPAQAATEQRALADAPEGETKTLRAMLDADSWPRRAIGGMRLERFTCDESRTILTNLLKDESPQVRAYAVATLGRLRVPGEASWFADEEDVGVIRTALRCRYAFDAEKLSNAVRTLCRSRSVDQQMLGIELGAASGDAELRELASATLRKFILRMDRIDAGRFAERIAWITSAPAYRRPTHWQRWLRDQGREFGAQSGHYIPENSAETITPSLIAQLDTESFVRLEGYLEEISARTVDLAIVIDCTSSMYREIAEAQGGVDDLMLFMNDLVESMRVGIVAYRDRRDLFETKGWPFSTNINEVRKRLWSLSADGGGDTPEAVYDALRAAYTQLDWNPVNTRMLILIGDAPPHIGYGSKCERMARLAYDNECVTHVIQAAGRDVKHFPEIAKAGGGEAVLLENDDSLVAEITGITFGGAFKDEVREFFRMYLMLCKR